MKLNLSKKQNKLLQDIVGTEEKEIYVLGSTQSGKTYDISLGVILYAQALHKYDPDEEYTGAIIGWATDTIKGNIVDVIVKFLDKLGFKKKDKKGIGDYTLKWGANSEDNYLQLWNVRFVFFSFNNALSFNKILGRPLIFVWVDESARIYSSKQLQEQFNQIPGRQMSYASHPYLKTTHSFNVEGSERHDYKVDILDKKTNAKHYTFFPFDNPKIDTPEAMENVINMFPPGSLREQKVYNKWVVAEGKVFNELNIIDNVSEYTIREIGLGIDYGNVNPTTFIPIALAKHRITNKWVLIRLECYYHDSKVFEDNPTTEYYSQQLRLFLGYLKKQYPHVPITTCVIDSEATHYHNRLLADNISHTLAKKGAGSVDEGVQHLQALIYKGYFLIMERPSITEMYMNGEIKYSKKDESLLEFESYQYDKVKSEKEGTNSYKKEMDHCLTKDALVLTENGYKKIIDLIGTKGKVYSYKNGKVVLRDYYNVHKTRENIDIYELELDNGYKIKGTYDHPILTTKGYKLLGELTNEDEVICYKENVMIVRVKNINKLDKEDTYNMEVEETHNFIANGMVVHNSIDASRYLLKEWVDTGRCPEI